MKKIRWIFSILAITLSIGGAWATRPKFMCFQAPQYILVNGTNYVPAGIFGQNYVCLSSPVVCTYSSVDGGFTFQPCRIGFYTRANLTDEQPKDGPKKTDEKK